MNYSKWDKLEVSSSDDGSDGDPDRDSSSNRAVKTKAKTKVTVLPDRATITIGPNGATFSPPSSLSPPPAGTTITTINAATTAAPNKVVTSSLSPSQTSCSDFATNGCLDENYHWSQTKDELLLYYDIPAYVKAKNLTVVVEPGVGLGFGPFLEVKSNVAVAATDGCNGVSGEVLLPSTQLLHDIALNAADEESCPVDWEIVQHGQQRHILLTLRKKSPFAGAVVWWKTVFRGRGKEIDVTTIAGRPSFSSIRDRSSESSMASVWDEAHRLFVEKVHQEREEPH